ncbi:MAG: hypothetical protein WBQ62_01325 [Dehalococcoidales bacterium]
MNTGSYVFIAIIIIIIILFSLSRRRGGVAKYPEIVQSLLFDVRINLALAKFFPELKKPRNFENTNWMMNKDKIGFLGESLKLMLRETFAMAEEYNKQIKAAKKAKSDSYKNIDLTRFKELLEKCRQELEDWMIQTTGSKDLPPKYPTLMGSLFGER